MSSTPTTSAPPAAAQSQSNASAWSRGPPATTASSSKISTPAQSGSPQPPAEVAHDAQAPLPHQNGSAGSAPVQIGAHSRKGSIMVGGGIEVKKGSLAFGTVDSPNPLLSSSPAAPSMTGAHLSDAVKSFGSIEADASTDPNAVKSTRNAGPGALNGEKTLNMHSLFGGRPKPNPGANGSSQGQGQGQNQTQNQSQGPPIGANGLPMPQHDRRQSMSNQQHPYQAGPNGLPQIPQMIPGQGHLRPPQAGSMPGQPSRSPNMGQNYPAPPTQHGFRPPMGQQQPFRPNGAGPQVQQPNMGRGMMGGYGGMHGAPSHGYMMPYGNQGYYDGYNVYNPQQFNIPAQWAPPQHPQNQPFNHPGSPRNGPAQLTTPSPAPPSAGLPSSGGASPIPAPTPPSRTPSLMGHQPQPSNASIASIAPSTPARPMMPTSASFTPPVAGQPPSFGLSGGASAFTPTPRKSAAIKISRPDGSSLDLKAAAAAVKGPMPVSTTPEPVAAPEPPKKKVPTLPVIVRLESEDQKKKRLAEEAGAAKIKAEEEAEERERKERVARRAAEEEQKRVQDEKDVETRRVKEEEEAAEKKQQEAAAAAAAAAAEQEAAKKAEEEREAAKKAEEEAKEKAEKEARDKAEEKRQALLTPTVSAPGSPLASPALGTAGLPPRPSGLPPTPSTVPRRPVPAALDIQSSPVPSNAPSSAAGPSALATAKPIEDLKSIVYPGDLKSPKADLNDSAEPGKFRYDREFLMQFMSVCKEKPEGLPPLEEIGLEPGNESSGFGNRPRGGRQSTAGGRGGGPTGLGIGLNGRPAFPGQGMGNFGTGMGNFGSGGATRGTTSEERFNRSMSQNKGMSRTPSQGLPAMGMSSSRSGANRSRAGVKRAPVQSIMEPSVAPLVQTQNSWAKSRPTGGDEGSPAFIERKVKALLNKLTAEKFASISTQILEWANKSANETDGMTLKLVIKQIFEKATDEAHWSNMYARLCKLLLDQLDPAITEDFEGKPVSGGLLFRKYLVGRCQMDFEAGWKAREDAQKAAQDKSDEDKQRLAEHAEKEKNGTEGGEAAMLSDEYYAAQKAKRRGLGLVQLIGELFKMDMLGKGVIRTCFGKLLANIEDADEEDLESAVKLLNTVGAQMEVVSPDNLEAVMQRLNDAARAEGVASRIKFAVMDINDTQRAGWHSRNKQAGVMTIAEIHQQAAKEQAEKSAAARESISRGGSRAGGRRDTQPGEWQSVASSARPVQRPADFSQLGRSNLSSSSTNNPPAFSGPNSVFNKKKGGRGGQETPPLSRQASTANMFSALNDEPEASSSERRGSAEAEPQRRRLVLAPRTEPLPGEKEGEEENEEEEGEEQAEEEPAAPAEMGVEGAKAKIASDMKELWGEKDVGGSRNPDDIAEYFSALPERHRTLLADKLVEEIFRICKIKDAEVVSKGWSAATAKDAVTKEVLIGALGNRMPSLDDDSVDFPQAYKAVGLLARAISLSDEEIDELLKKVEVYGEPRVTPKMKLDRALEAIDADAAAAAAAAAAEADEGVEAEEAA